MKTTLVLALVLILSSNSFAYKLNCPKNYKQEKIEKGTNSVFYQCSRNIDGIIIRKGPYAKAIKFTRPGKFRSLRGERILEKGFFEANNQNYMTKKVPLIKYKYTDDLSKLKSEIHLLENRVFTKRIITTKKGLKTEYKCYEQDKMSYLSMNDPEAYEGNDIEYILDPLNVYYLASYAYGLLDNPYAHDRLTGATAKTKLPKGPPTITQVLIAFKRMHRKNYQNLKEYIKTIKSSGFPSLKQYDKISYYKKKSRQMATRLKKLESNLLKKISPNFSHREEANCDTLTIMNAEFDEGTIQKDRNAYKQKQLKFHVPNETKEKRSIKK